MRSSPSELCVIWPSNPTPRHIPWGNKNWKRHMYPIVHCSTIYNKQPRCPLTDEWIKKLWYIYTMECYSAIKRNTFESSNEVDEPRAYYTEWGKSERERYILYTNAYIWNLEKWIWIIYLQGSSGETDIENRPMHVGRGEERVRCLERGTWKLTLPYVK